MKRGTLMKILFSLVLISLTPMMTSCGGSLAQQIFNTEFLTSTGLQTGGAADQITPDLPQYLVLKVTNQSTYPAKVIVTIKRALADEIFDVTLNANQTVGKLIENCNSATNPVLSLYVPLLQDTTDQQNVTPIPIGQAFVIVEGLPVVVPASELPGVLNVRDHFNCGDTVTFVVHSSFTDIDRYSVSAVVYAAGTQ